MVVPGFKKYIRPNIIIEAAQTARIDAVLQLGGATESVTVTDTAPLLKTESGELSQNISSDQMNNLPVLGIGAAAAKLFAKEGTWKGGIGSAKGPAGIQAMLEKAMAKSPPYDPAKVRSFHLLTNFSIQVDGDKLLKTSGTVSPVLQANDIIVVPAHKPLLSNDTVTVVTVVGTILSIALAAFTLSRINHQ